MENANAHLKAFLQEKKLPGEVQFWLFRRPDRRNGDIILRLTILKRAVARERKIWFFFSLTVV